MDTGGFSMHGSLAPLYTLLPKKAWNLGVIEVVEVWWERNICMSLAEGGLYYYISGWAWPLNPRERDQQWGWDWIGRVK